MKKKITNELTGRTVLVHPELTTDPTSRQGETGIVVEISSSNPGVLIVEFNDGSKGAYLADGVLTMQPKKDILKSLLENSMNISGNVCKNMIRICRLLSERRQGDALELAISDETTQALCTINCETRRELKATQRKNISKGKRLK